MKKTLSNHAQVAHAWAHQTQPEGKSSNFFFDGPEIYSYGRHFQTGYIAQAPNGERVYFLNSNSYSNSTAKHQAHTCHAIPTGQRRFSVPFPGNRLVFWEDGNNLSGVIEALKAKAELSFRKQIKAVSNYYYFTEGATYLNTARTIVGLFNLSVSPTSFELAKLGQQAKEKAAQLRRTEPERKARAIERSKNKAAIEFERQKNALKNWLKGERNGTMYNVPVHLRLVNDGQEIQTTKGATVPTSQALEIWERIIRGENVTGQQLGNYTINRVDRERLVIGCHEIEINTVRQFVENIRANA